MWFHKKDLIFHPSIIDKSIRGYVLPHAGTTYTGKVISYLEAKFYILEFDLKRYPIH